MFSKPKHKPSHITSISVSGFKSLMEKTEIAISPLTILAGSNSSGKSSIMQPLLLLKQTLEASYDPGPLLLTGPNARFSSADQLFSFVSSKRRASELSIKLTFSSNNGFASRFVKGKGIDLVETAYLRAGKDSSTLQKDMTSEELLKQIPSELSKITKALSDKSMNWSVFRNRCFLEARFQHEAFGFSGFGLDSDFCSAEILNVIHLPGLRGNPERSYPVGAIGSKFPGSFEVYTASILSQWSGDQPEKLESVNSDLRELGLTAQVIPRPINDTQVELHVSRLPNVYKPKDTVNIADVGFGVSQSLPLIVALSAARPGQLLYVEQPEIHLHPRAQWNLASILAKAVKRGVRVVVETHSNLLILGLQTLVAQKKLSASQTQFHWFTRRETDGVTEVNSVQLDDRGRYGGWPVDFAEVTLAAEDAYLTSQED